VARYKAMKCGQAMTPVVKLWPPPNRGPWHSGTLALYSACSSQVQRTLLVIDEQYSANSVFQVALYSPVARYWRGEGRAAVWPFAVKFINRHYAGGRL